MSSNGQFGIVQWFRSGTGQWVLVVLILVGVYLITEHTSHVLGLLPFGLLLLCPLLHLFMHGGHDDHDEHQPPGGGDAHDGDKYTGRAAQDKVLEAVPVPVKHRRQAKYTR